MKYLSFIILLTLVNYAYGQDYIENQSSSIQPASFKINSTSYIIGSGNTYLNIGQTGTTTTNAAGFSIDGVNGDFSGLDYLQIYQQKDGNAFIKNNNTAGNLILGTGGGTERMRITLDGSIGIGTANPSSLLHLKKDVIGDTYLRVQNNLDNPAATAGIMFSTLNGNWQLTAKRSTGFSLSAPTMNNVLYVMNNGNIGIGTTAPQSLLSVNGEVTAKKIRVTQNGWADFVFEPGYDLPSLAELASFIKENKHLPGIPSTEEVNEEGVDVSEMNQKLLQKIEELTLYVIQLKEEIEELKAGK
ncbi:hypothetical protein COR50_14410 [Chitinophaga caeni]|uniref:Peptidase S74 domain-containing protein n=1 Tax=Chitinophaga caeni TaxID=2029983 RepID=A0A291QW51_9BACT|nr:hypothetical protein [Chitinophaga caeni]ATL48259.1 hypothetical protein COR50_14410 [Chitinophaga caeni]